MDSVEEGHIRAEMRRRREVESLHEREGAEAAEYAMRVEQAEVQSTIAMVHSCCENCETKA